MNAAGYKILKLRANRIWNKMVMKGLYLWYRLSRRTLKVYHLSEPDPVILSGNHFQLQWLVSGCYKVVINTSIVLPGNAGSVTIDSRKVNELLIQFYGVKEMFRRSFYIQPIEAGLKQDLNLVWQEDQYLTQTNWQGLRLEMSKLPPIQIQTLRSPVFQFSTCVKSTTINQQLRLEGIRLETFNKYKYITKI